MVEQGMNFQLLSTRLYDAALLGDVPSLLHLLREDPLILHRCSIEKAGRFTQSPLHVAANLGHLEFTREILCREPELAEELDHSQRSSPLHMSSAKGHLAIVKALLEVKPEMCLAQDQNGRNPIHVAAIRGQCEVLQELLEVKPQAARERTYGGETVLHLCIKHNQPEALKFLVHFMDDDKELLNSKDSDGNTILHLAVAAKQLETIKFLLEKENMEKNAINTSGLTAMDTWLQSRKDPRNKEIKRCLKRAKALRAKKARKLQQKPDSWLKDQRNSVMVSASVIATMAFQIGMSPPGGTWQDDKNGHTAGDSVFSHYKGYYGLLISNTVALLSSFTVILLLVSGLPCKKLFVIILMITMWIAITAITLTYFLSVAFLTYPTNIALDILGWALLAWGALTTLPFLGHVIRFIVKLIKQLVLLVPTLWERYSTSRATNRPILSL